MSANWGFWMYDHDKPYKLHGVMRYRDKEMGPFIEINHFRYGLQTITSGTICLKGFITFNINQEKDVVIAIHPGLNLHDVICLDDIETHHHLSNHCYRS